MLRRASNTFELSDPPEGVIAAGGAIASKVIDKANPSRPVAVDHDTGRPIADTLESGDRSERPSSIHHNHTKHEENDHCSRSSATTAQAVAQNEYDSFANGYHFPPHRRWQETFKIGSIAFLKYVMTPMGFAVTLYMLLVVSFGSMIFLLICNAVPAMCHPTCNDINSPRRKWIEYCSQILNGLFCITAFGLAPWRFRDMYWLLKYRIRGNVMSLRRLAGIHRSWFRLQGSQNLAPEVGPRKIDTALAETDSETAIPFPPEKTPDPPLTGFRAPPTKPWKMDYVVGMYVANTILQAGLAALEWGMDRYTRPGWGTGLLVGGGMVSGCLAGWMQFSENRAIKHIEGVAVSPDDLKRLNDDKELGVQHFNNLKAKKPKNNEDKISMQRRLNAVEKSRTTATND